MYCIEQIITRFIDGERQLPAGITPPDSPADNAISHPQKYLDLRICKRLPFEKEHQIDGVIIRRIVLGNDFQARTERCKHGTQAFFDALGAFSRVHKRLGVSIVSFSNLHLR